MLSERNASLTLELEKLQGIYICEHFILVTFIFVPTNFLTLDQIFYVLHSMHLYLYIFDRSYKEDYQCTDRVNETINK